MNAYLFALLTLAIATVTVGVILPSQKQSGVGRQVEALLALLLVACLLSPVKALSELLSTVSEGEILLPAKETVDHDRLRDALQGALDESSRLYFAQMLTDTLEREFSLSAGEIKVSILWNESGSAPQRVTLLLSGGAVWKDPAPMEEYVCALLHCPCRSAIE